MNKYDTFEWVKRVIDSVENNSQDMSAERLVDNFDKMFNDYDLTRELMNYSIGHLVNWNK